MLSLSSAAETGGERERAPAFLRRSGNGRPPCIDDGDDEYDATPRAVIAPSMLRASSSSSLASSSPTEPSPIGCAALLGFLPQARERDAGASTLTVRLRTGGGGGAALS